MPDPAPVVDRIESCFRTIRETRMDGVPILNDALDVRLVNPQRWENNWLAILITPWFMNLLLLPDADDEQPVATGTKRLFRFPAGPFEFIRGDEPEIGTYWMCSLFSPVLEFADQETAEACADAALQSLFEAEEAPGQAEQDMQAVWRGEIVTVEKSEELDPVQEADVEADPVAVPAAAPEELSRRALLTGGLSREVRDGS
ncbi:[NiFe]-hydrogenase assembly chaperone HybE [Roseibium sp. MMSF_3544]|uniref:[NiFe]-hydrogenase assembly chaperone HybE n=1 Tax=unclassified Roseibium TaxID=2629323 RepID=UPI00273D0AB8|nr:[NiFe]-hydrogenase assembly chaperone HybE [Roseibium sp. MMSF_3544]